MTKREMEIRRRLLHTDMINIQARMWTRNLSEPLEALDAELRAPLAEEEQPQHTWQQERDAVVEWLRRQSGDGSTSINTTLKNLCVLIERGEHWPAERDKS